MAPDGNDRASGKQDQPFATLPQALAAARQFGKEQPARNQPITVLVRGGRYFLGEPLRFTPEDSGTADSPLIIAACPGEKPVFSGGVRISGWKRDARGYWQTTLPTVASGEWNFSHLFVNGQRRLRPRLPKQGYYYIAEKVAPTPQSASRGFDRFQFEPGQIRGDWRNRDDVEVLAFQIWTMARMRIAQVDESSHIVTFTGPSRCTAAQCDYPKGNRFLVENVAEALGSPGEWYLDRKSGVLTYVPVEGEKPETADVVAPRLDTLVAFDGDAAGRRTVDQIWFRGLAFEHSNWNLPAAGYDPRQAESRIGGAITATGARDLVFEECRVAHTANYAFALSAATKRARIENCELLDLGAGGVRIGDDAAPPPDDALPGNHVIRGNAILHGGRHHPSAIGVLVMHSPYNVIERNDIADFYYSGISVGWVWGYAQSVSHHNTIALNRIGRIGQGVLSDMGGIYTLGVSPGTVIRDNFIYDVDSFDYGGWGVYLDEGSTNILVENNITWRTKSAGFHQHYGRENFIANNIFALGREAQVQRTRAEEHLSFTFERNIVAGYSGPVLTGNFTGSGYTFHNNLYWMMNGQPLYMTRMSWEQWRQAGHDDGSLAGDPLFYNLEGGDFRLRDNSPALALGFRAIDVGAAGRGISPRDDVPAPTMFPYSQSGSGPIAEDFESTALGAVPLFVQKVEKTNAVAGATEELAHSGRRSLKFSDSVGYGQYYPHIYYKPNLAATRLTGSFWFYKEPDADFNHEWRTAGGEYLVGPTVRVLPDGTVRSNNAVLGKIPSRQWVRFELSARVGTAANGRYDIAVTLPDGSKLSGKDLPCNPQFNAVRWWGFVSLSSKPATFYIDDLSLRESQ